MASSLCSFCQGQRSYIRQKNFHCEKSDREPFYHNHGALRCSQSCPVDAAFVDPTALDSIDESEKDEFRLMCADGTHAPLSNFRKCNLGRGPVGGVVTQMNTSRIARKFLVAAQTCNLGAIPPNIVMTCPVLTARIYDLIMKSQETTAACPDSGFHLFESLQYGESDLLFKDATKYLVHSSHMDCCTILGEEFYSQAESIFNCTHSNILQFCNQDVCSIF